MKTPATLDEFYRIFPTEWRRWEPLRRLRWPEGFRCPRCEGRKTHWPRARGLWQCASCRYQAWLTAGTPFQGTRVPLRAWLPAMFYRQLAARSSRSAAALEIASSRITRPTRMAISQSIGSF